jgi:phage shock protein A
LQLQIASLRDMVRKQADELQASNAEVTTLKQQLQQAKADKVTSTGLQKQIESLNSERESEVR